LAAGILYNSIMLENIVSSPFEDKVSFVCVGPQALLSYKAPQDEMCLLSDNAAPKRRQEFLLGRAAASRALTQIGIDPPPPVGKGQFREPIWPDGVVGSISHSGETAIAAVALQSFSDGIGIDLEIIREQRDISQRLCQGPEYAWVHEHQDKAAERLTILFSAKESLFKAIFPMYGKYFWYKDVELSWNPDSSCFDATLLFSASKAYPSGSQVQIGCKVIDSSVFTWTLLPKREICDQ